MIFSPPMYIGYSRPNSEATFFSASSMALRFSGFEKSTNGSFVNSERWILASAVATAHFLLDRQTTDCTSTVERRTRRVGAGKPRAALTGPLAGPADRIDERFAGTQNPTLAFRGVGAQMIPKILKCFCFLALVATPGISGCGGGTVQSSGNPAAPPPTQNPDPPTPAAKSAKRGVAYDLADPADFAALSPGVSWWYNWSSQPNNSTPTNYNSKYNMDFYPMLWNGNFNAASVTSYLQANPGIKYVLVLNEPNLSSQANTTPQQAAQLWPQYEAISRQTGVKIVGPAITWGTMANYQDPVAWLDAFYAAYQSANNGNNPQIDYLAFHWYDYGLSSQLDRLDKYNKSIWVTEF